MADDGSPVNGARSKGNVAMLDTAFLYGGSAQWLEQMQAAYSRDPSSVPESWQAFFEELDDNPNNSELNAAGASWKRADWPLQKKGDDVAAFDGNWAVLDPRIEKKIKADKP
ncbi:MAG: 2-oxoglutarate dehydrogenase E1 component, partial [Alphaproteobacteria bacterium]|nr:2-oxoglutarate dehydrogenase E1 component [Alphaproteobacteria bacterium]